MILKRPIHQPISAVTALVLLATVNVATPTQERHPFPRRIHFTGWFDTGKQGKEWPGDFQMVAREPPQTWFAVYDAPEPWGPWTTAFFTEAWDVGPGEHGDFPAKWMSADGHTLHLVFSGDDCFSVRKATLILNRTDAPTGAPYPLAK